MKSLIDSWVDQGSQRSTRQSGRRRGQARAAVPTQQLSPEVAFGYLGHSVQEEGRRRLWAPPGQEARAVLAERDLGAARHVFSLRRQFKKKGAIGSGHRRAKGFRRCLQSATWERLTMAPRFTASSRRRAPSALGTAVPRGPSGACRARLGGTLPWPFVSPPVQEEGRRLLWAPPSHWARAVLAERDVVAARHIPSDELVGTTR